MTPFTCYLSSTFATLPALPEGVVPLPTVYPDRSRNVLDSTLRPGLHAVTEAGYAAPMVDDPKAQDELAAYLLSHGVRDCVIDWEAPETPANVVVLRKMVKRLRSKGLSPDLYGLSDVLTPLTKDLHPVWAPFTTDHEKWVRTRQRELLRTLQLARQSSTRRRVIGWLYTQYGQSGDFTPVPAGQYIGDDAVNLYLRSVFCYCDAVCWWPGMGADGNWRKPEELPEGWDVFAEFAKEMAGN